MVSRATLKSWFQTFSKPTSAQFAEWIDSYWSKVDDTIKISDIAGLPEMLAGGGFVITAIYDDADDDFTGGLLAFINQGDAPVYYYIGTDDVTVYTLLPGGTYWMAYDDANPDMVPRLIFDDNSLYALYPDGTSLANKNYQLSAAATFGLSAFNKADALAYITANGNGDVDIDVKNLLVSVNDTLNVDGSPVTDSSLRSSVTQFQIQEIEGGEIVYDGLTSMSANYEYVSSTLIPGRHYKVLVASSDTNLAISVFAGDNAPILKAQNFLTGDPDNYFTSPLQIFIQPAA